MNNTAENNLFLEFINKHYKRRGNGRYIEHNDIERINRFCKCHKILISYEVIKTFLPGIIQTNDINFPTMICNSDKTVIQLFNIIVILDEESRKVAKQITAFDYRDFVEKYVEAISKENGKNKQKKANKPKKRRLFIDMDGTIVVWNGDASFEEVAAPGYFSNIAPMSNSLMAVKYLVTELSDKYEVFILSSVFEDGHSVRDKNIWLDRYLPEIDAEHRIFVPYSRTKRDFVKEVTGAIYDSDVLVDDFTKNLVAWHGVGIKILNGINGSKGTWNGYVISHNMAPETMARAIDALACA